VSGVTGAGVVEGADAEAVLVDDRPVLDDGDGGTWQPVDSSMEAT
jgi:hypothetical protein